MDLCAEPEQISYFALLCDFFLLQQSQTCNAICVHNVYSAKLLYTLWQKNVTSV